MQSLTDIQKEWIQWCHSDQTAAQRDSALEAVVRMVEYSPYPDPVVLAESRQGDSLARGFAVACEGSIAYLGRVRSEGDGSNQQVLLSRVIAELCRNSLAKGVEIVQVILPSHADLWTKNRLQIAMEGAGMIRAARLLQLECCDIPLRHDASPLALAFSPIAFHPFSEMPWDRWCELVESTYTDTLDVPILNGVRSVEQTLRGYAAGQSKSTLPWSSIHAGAQTIGCLILTSISESDCELTYLGLVPSARGHRYSPEIMDYVSGWMLHQGKSRIVLAVDERNTPALHLYESFGFEQIHAVDAWFLGQPSSVRNAP
jgi:ribosomal protein S18 acetylase RimI-like enzyme